TCEYPPLSIGRPGGGRRPGRGPGAREVWEEPSRDLTLVPGRGVARDGRSPDPGPISRPGRGRRHLTAGPRRLKMTFVTGSRRESLLWGPVVAIARAAGSSGGVHAPITTGPPSPPAARLHADRAAHRHRHRQRPGGGAAAGRAGVAGGVPAGPVPEQPEAG